MMPIVTVTMRRAKDGALKASVLEAIHTALVSAGVNPDDRFHRIIELESDNFRYHPTFPDLTSPRGDDFLLVEILLGVGRSVKVKKQIIAEALRGLAALGVDPEHVMFVFQDVAWENWSPGGGRVPHG